MLTSSAAPTSLLLPWAARSNLLLIHQFRSGFPLRNFFVGQSQHRKSLRTAAAIRRESFYSSVSRRSSEENACTTASTASFCRGVSGRQPSNRVFNSGVISTLSPSAKNWDRVMRRGRWFPTCRWTAAHFDDRCCVSLIPIGRTLLPNGTPSSRVPSIIPVNDQVHPQHHHFLVIILPSKWNVLYFILVRILHLCYHVITNKGRYGGKLHV